MPDIDNSQDVISVEDITDCFAELRDERESFAQDVEDKQDDLNQLEEDEEGRSDAEDELALARKELQQWDADNAEELETLTKLLDEIRGYGGDHQFEGDWYPGSLIRESYFVEYVRDMLEDIGELPRNLPGYIAIDWDKTAANVGVDYSSVEYDGVEYLYR